MFTLTCLNDYKGILSMGSLCLARFMQKNDILQITIISFLIALLISIFGHTLLSLSSTRQESKIIDGLASWWLAKSYFAEQKPPDIVILGSDQLAPLLGADAYAYNRVIDATDDHRSYVLEHDIQALLNKHLRVFIGALPGAMISDQLVISRALFSKEYKPRLVAIMFSPRDFIDNYFPSENLTEAFAFFSKYTDSTSLHSALDKIRTEQYGFKQTSNYESGEKPPLHLGKPFQRISAGDVIIYSNDSCLFKNDTAEYSLRYKNPLSQKMNRQMDCLDVLLKYLAQQHIQAIAFNCPISAANKKLLPNNFWKYYDDRISKICRKNGADYISADRVVLPFEDNEFIDGVHLNLTGGLRWSRPVAVYIANRFRWKTYQELLALANKCLI